MYENLHLDQIVGLSEDVFIQVVKIFKMALKGDSESVF